MSLDKSRKCTFLAPAELVCESKQYSSTSACHVLYSVFCVIAYLGGSPLLPGRGSFHPRTNACAKCYYAVATPGGLPNGHLSTGLPVGHPAAEGNARRSNRTWCGYNPNRTADPYCHTRGTST